MKEACRGFSGLVDCLAAGVPRGDEPARVGEAEWLCYGGAMSVNDKVARELDDVVRDLDLIVFSLERPAGTDTAARDAERARLHRELERLRERLDDLARGL